VGLGKIGPADVGLDADILPRVTRVLVDAQWVYVVALAGLSPRTTTDARASGRMIDGRPNKELKLTKPSPDGASQLNSVFDGLVVVP
jgi:hypothetical protein